MKIELTNELEESIKSNLLDVFKEKEIELNKGNIVDVLQEIGATGSRLFMKVALKVMKEANINGLSMNIDDLINKL